MEKDDNPKHKDWYRLIACQQCRNVQAIDLDREMTKETQVYCPVCKRGTPYIPLGWGGGNLFLGQVPE